MSRASQSTDGTIGLTLALEPTRLTSSRRGDDPEQCRALAFPAMQLYSLLNVAHPRNTGQKREAEIAKKMLGQIATCIYIYIYVYREQDANVMRCSPLEPLLLGPN